MDADHACTAIFDIDTFTINGDIGGLYGNGMVIHR
jgi:hypothetical protein